MCTSVQKQIALKGRVLRKLQKRKGNVYCSHVLVSSKCSLGGFEYVIVTGIYLLHEHIRL